MHPRGLRWQCEVNTVPPSPPPLPPAAAAPIVHLPPLTPPLYNVLSSTDRKVHGQELRSVFSFVHETFLTIDSTANRAKYNKAQARATLDHILQVRWGAVRGVCPARLPRFVGVGGAMLRRAACRCYDCTVCIISCPLC